MTDRRADADVILSLPDDLRTSFKDPLGPIYTQTDAILERANEPVISVGDVVTHHLVRAGRMPSVAVVDGLTERTEVSEEVATTIEGIDGVRVNATNPPGTLSISLIEALRRALETSKPVLVVVNGEEDLAVLPVLVLAPTGASVVYGQPGEGMVHVTVTEEKKTHVRELLDRMDGDTERARTLLS